MIEDLNPGDVVLVKLKCYGMEKGAYLLGSSSTCGALWMDHSEAKECIVGVQKMCRDKGGNTYYLGTWPNPPEKGTVRILKRSFPIAHGWQRTVMKPTGLLL